MNYETFFLKCPIKSATGLSCPGCGSQRAIVAFATGNFRDAFRYNAIIFFVPIFMYLADHPPRGIDRSRFRIRLIGLAAALSALYTIVRNFPRPLPRSISPNMTSSSKWA